jgi:hypothetical protein
MLLDGVRAEQFLYDRRLDRVDLSLSAAVGARTTRRRSIGPDRRHPAFVAAPGR